MRIQPIGAQAEAKCSIVINPLEPDFEGIS